MFNKFSKSTQVDDKPKTDHDNVMSFSRFALAFIVEHLFYLPTNLTGTVIAVIQGGAGHAKHSRSHPALTNILTVFINVQVSLNNHKCRCVIGIVDAYQNRCDINDLYMITLCPTITSLSREVIHIYNIHVYIYACNYLYVYICSLQFALINATSPSEQRVVVGESGGDNIRLRL